ncbi:MAG: preprotein translocase subunit YajC [Desulfovibrionaceae bacterium]
MFSSQFANLAFALAGGAQQAPAGGSAQGSGGIAGLLAGPLPMLIIMFAIFYFLLIRPQQKKAKQHKEMLAALKSGDKVVTGGGIYGVITDIDQDIISVEIAPDVTIRINRAYVSGLAEGVKIDQKKKK